ncbi:hypothetical protein [Halorarius litoreus]|uniref:hypothetical protein n=1 Tax=Halorarius litoreus TaxID=2962676 RepID=UPI0020CFB27E|nr:hypothetical protein [Halorarius litoreus]
MATRRGPPDRLTGSRGSGPTDRLDQFAESARAARRDDDAALADAFDRMRGLGCPAGDMRLAYGWRAAVVTAALAALLVGLVTRLAMTGLFVRFVTDGLVPVAGFNLTVTVLATLTLGLVRARRFRLAVHHRLVPIRRGFRRRYVRWRRSARQRNRHRRDRLAYRCRRALRAWPRRLRTWQRRRRHRRTARRVRWRRALVRWPRAVRTRLRRRRTRSGGLGARLRRRMRRAYRRLRGRLRQRRYGRTASRRAAALALLFGR